MSEVTRILDSLKRSEAKAAEELLPVVYTELRKLAAAKMASEAPGQTLQPTALVHEAWLLVLYENRGGQWQVVREQATAVGGFPPTESG